MRRTFGQNPVAAERPTPQSRAGNARCAADTLATTHPNREPRGQADPIRSCANSTQRAATRPD
eukprot:9142543-Alexandrium_andersonii.AAC.1